MIPLRDLRDGYEDLDGEDEQGWGCRIRWNDIKRMITPPIWWRHVQNYLRLSVPLDEDEATTSGITDGAADEQNRVIFINRVQPQKFVSNRISTAKYRCMLPDA
ncbi:uncharacterized protein LOC119833328 [Zerene cesonia]|uniref:uncharacterized protein LOC119833328 n=1 Tax=Zerene cesonia TaxID=33412 RepID=UPI0018E55026|nr:uncharacterized protein LOC119833328 [Zerene cesonia]